MKKSKNICRGSSWLPTIFNLGRTPHKTIIFMTTEHLKEFFNEEGFVVYMDEEFTEIEKWTDGGVDMIITLQPFTAQEFIKYVNDFDIDEEIKLHRQDPSYKSNFTITQSLKDFKNFHKSLKKSAAKIK